MELASNHGLHVPRVLAFASGAFPGNYSALITEAVDGAEPRRFIQLSLWQRPVWERLGRLHAALHSIEAEAFAPSTSPLLDRLQHLSCFAEDHVSAAARLADGVSPRCYSVVHGDFHPGNVVGSRAAHIIDWTGVHVDDALSDVARTLVLGDIALACLGPGDAILRRLIARCGDAYLAGYERERSLDYLELSLWRRAALAVAALDARVNGLTGGTGRSLNRERHIERSLWQMYQRR